MLIVQSELMARTPVTLNAERQAAPKGVLMAVGIASAADSTSNLQLAKFYMPQLNTD